MLKRRHTGAFFVTLIVFLSSLGGCTGLSFSRPSEPAGFKNADLVGMVYQVGNRPCPGVSVELLQAGKGEAVFRGITDLNGRFVVPRLPRGEHRLRFTRQGYQDLTVAIRFIDPTHIFYTRLVSLEDLLLQVEEALDSNRWNQVEDLLFEAARIEPLRGEILFLKAVAAARRGLDDEARRLLTVMGDYGFPLPCPGDREGRP